jgi:hypothetical protein
MLTSEMIDSVTQRQITAQDQWGSFTFTNVSRKANVEYRNRTIQGTDGNYVVSVGVVRMKYLPIITSITSRATATIHMDDLITVDGVDHRILKLCRAKSLHQTYFIEVYIA